MKIASTFRSVLLSLVPVLVWCAADAELLQQDQPEPGAQEPDDAQAVQVQYLEIVTPDMDATCSALEKVHGVRFGEPEADLGNARTAALAGGGRIGVRKPMHDAETPVVRPYLVVDDIDAAAEAAAEAGADFMVPPMEAPGRGKYAIYFLGGIQHALWQN